MKFFTLQRTYHSRALLFALISLSFLSFFAIEASSQTHSCQSGKIIHIRSGKVLSTLDAESRISDLERLRKRLVAKVKLARKSVPVDLNLVKKLKKKLAAVVTQIRELKDLTKSCIKVETSLVYSETVKLPGYSLTTYHHRSKREGEKIAVTASLVNDAGEVVTKHFMPVTGRELTNSEFLETKGPAYFWDKDPEKLCTDTFCPEDKEVVPVILTEGGTVLFELRDDSVVKTQKSPSNRFYARDIKSLTKAGEHIKLQTNGTQESIFPHSIDKTGIVYGASSEDRHLIPRWSALDGKRIRDLDLSAALLPLLMPYEKLVTDPETGDPLCENIVDRKLGITDFKVNNSGGNLGVFDYKVLCRFVAPGYVSPVTEVEMPFMKGVFISDSNGQFTLKNEFLWYAGMRGTKIPFLSQTLAYSNNGLGILFSSFGSSQEEKVSSAPFLFSSKPGSEELSLNYQGVNPDLLVQEGKEILKLPSAINNFGDFVGTHTLLFKDPKTSTRISEAFARIGGKYVNLDSLMPTSSNYIVLNASGINNCGTIVGGLKDTKNLEYVGFKLSPDGCK